MDLSRKPPTYLCPGVSSLTGLETKAVTSSLQPVSNHKPHGVTDCTKLQQVINTKLCQLRFKMTTHEGIIFIELYCSWMAVMSQEVGDAFILLFCRCLQLPSGGDDIRPPAVFLCRDNLCSLLHDCRRILDVFLDRP